MSHSGVPIPRTDLVGSLMRPAELTSARKEYKAGNIVSEQLREAEDRAISEAVADLRRIGLGVVTDGEMRRDTWMTNLSEAVDGFASEYPVVTVTRPDGQVENVEMHSKPVVSRLLQRRRLVAGEDLNFLKPLASGALTKVTLPSPAYSARRSFKVGVSDKVYPDVGDLLAVLTEIVRGELSQLAAEGVDYVQLDEGFTAWVNEETRATIASEPAELERLLARDIAVENSCHDLLPPGVVRAIHICRGNRTSWMGGAGSYDWLAERLFNELHVDRFLLEFDDERRTGSFEPLRFLPAGKIAVLGLVTTKSAELESRDDLMRRIEEASRFCPIERLALSPQCGFYHGEDDSTMTIADQWRKLELVVDTAKAVWG